MSKNTAQYPAAQWDGSSPSRAADNGIDRHPDFEDWDQMVAEMQAVQAEIDKGKYLTAVPNPTGGAVAPGKAVYLLANGTGIALADANGTAPARNVCGLVASGATAIAVAANIIQDGDLTLTTAQWDTVTGDSGGLVPFTEYYLSGSAGAVTKTVPATTGDTDIVVGVAKTATTMNVRVRHILSSHA